MVRWACVTCLLLFLFLVCSREVACATQDGPALLQFLSQGQIKGEAGQAVLGNWNQTEDPCIGPWQGVTCSGGLVEKLNLTSLGLVGFLTDSLAQLQGLDWLDLSRNSLQGDIGVLVNLTNLKVLQLSQNQLSGSIPEAFQNFVNLEMLDLSQNQLSGPIPAGIANLSNMQSLKLNINNLTGPIPILLGSTGALSLLDLSSNSLNSAIPDAMCDKGLLTYIDLSDNQLEGQIPAGINRCTNLSRLRLGNNLLDGPIPPAVGQLSNLLFLEIWNNNLTGPIPEELGNCYQLQSINLKQNSLTGSIPFTLAQITNLKQLDLSGNGLASGIPPPLLDNNELITLDLSFNHLNGSIPVNVGNLTRLETLFLHNNQLSGVIPSTLGALPNLLQVDLGNNSLDGSIPMELGNLINLQIQLSLGFNYLMGMIPPSFGKLSKLILLDLSHNQLSGNVPEELTQMSSLSVLDLSHNLLTGELPVFPGRLSGNISVAGNLGLCSPGSGNLGIPPCNTQQHKRDGGSGNLSGKVLRDFGFAVAAVVLVVGLSFVCVWSYRRVKVVNGAWRRQVDVEPAVPAVGRFFTNAYDRDGVKFEELIKKSVVEEQVISINRFSTLFRAANLEGPYPDLTVKRVPVDRTIVDEYRQNSQELEKALQKEYLSHKNIMKPVGYILHDDCICILHESVPNGVLRQRLSATHGHMKWAVRYNIALGVAEGLACVHDGVRTPVIHLDITSANIFLNAMFDAVIGDCELVDVIEASKPHAKSITTVAGSIGYIAPEYAYTMQVTKKSNVYSFGVVLMEILTGKEPTDDSYGSGLDLVGWVKEAPSRGDTPEQILDPSVSTESFPVRQQMLAVLKVALCCTDSSPLQRPDMQTVVDMLRRTEQQPQPKPVDPDSQVITAQRS